MIKVLKHGKFYNHELKATCMCGCEFEYETFDILRDDSLMLLTYPGQYKTYVLCPECKARVELGTTFVSNKGFTGGGI